MNGPAVSCAGGLGKVEPMTIRGILFGAAWPLLAGLSVIGCGGHDFGGGELDVPPAVAKPVGPYDKPGFVGKVLEGRLWVYREDSRELRSFEVMGPSDKHVTRVGAGPGGMTVKGPDAETINEYLAAKDGFYTHVIDGRIWVFRDGSPEKDEFIQNGPSDKHVSRICAGPGRMTVKGPDTKTVLAYIIAKPGFSTHVVDGRIWVFRPGSDDLAAFLLRGPSDRHSTRVGAGPSGMTVKGPDSLTIKDYLASAPGFYTEVIEDRIWVFRLGTDELKEFKEMGPSDKHSSRIGGGPMRMTVKGPDMETINAYIRAAGVRPRPVMPPRDTQ